MTARVALAMGVCCVVVACSSPPTLQGEGGRCQQVSDCKVPLVCVPGPNGTLVCSNDTSSLVNTEDAALVDVGSAPSSSEAGPD